MSSNKDRIKSMWLPAWAAELVTLYEAGSTSQFLCYGNVHDRLLMPLKEGVRLGTLSAFLNDVMMPRFDVVLSYDLGNGLTVERGGETFAKWPRMRDTGPRLPREPAAAVDLLSHYIRFVGNLRRLGQPAPQVGIMVRGAELIVPAGGGGGQEVPGVLVQSPAHCGQRDRAGCQRIQQTPVGDVDDSVAVRLRCKVVLDADA